jgi:pimeloyl-ACP methyl ester carboxylesterase
MRRELFVTADDGTELYVDDRGPVGSKQSTIVCLPGLTRNSRDFDPVFRLLSNQRRVIAMDLRGRGKSAAANDPTSYTPLQELQDVLLILGQLNLDRVAIIGTSRGGIIGMLMANMARERLAGLLLNDVGPVLDPVGLARIAQYVGAPVSHATWEGAAQVFADKSIGFKGVSQAQWIAAIKRIYKEENGRIVHCHDLALGTTLPSRKDIAEGKVPDLWALVPALRDLPVALLRGSGSDLLTEETARAFALQANIQHHATVPNRGHVPFLDEAESVQTILSWLAAVDAKEKGR